MPYTNEEEDDTHENIFFTTALISIELSKCHTMLS
jgi:hypothetical protein